MNFGSVMAKAPAIIRHYGEPKKARTLKGVAIGRQDSLFVAEWGAFVPCAPYDDHFLYATNEQESSAYLCTCGAPAVVINPEDPRTRMFVCLVHAQEGKHMTSYVETRDFSKVAGKTIEG